jgi:long-chain-fatty-acid--CoA ligase ACSBG
MGNASYLPTGPPTGPNPGPIYVHDGGLSRFNTSAYLQNFKLEDPPADSLPNYEEKGQVYVTDPDAKSVIRQSKIGVGSIKPTTIIHAFAKAAKKAPKAVAYRFEEFKGNKSDEWTTQSEASKQNDDSKGPVESRWVERNWEEYYNEVKTLAAALLTLGLKRHECVNIIGFNSRAWVLSDLATIFAGGIVTGIYSTNGPDACKYITEHSNARVVFVENQKQLDKFLTFRDELPNLSAIVMWDGKVDPAVNEGDSKVEVLEFDAFMKRGELDDPEHEINKLLKERMEQQEPNDACTLIYTSGTTGNPKAVMLSHDNCTWTAMSVQAATLGPDVLADWEGKDLPIVSYLPLSHIAAQTLDIFAPIMFSAETKITCSTNFARPDALKGSLKQTLQDIRPGLFFGVPRVWEKFQEAITAAGKHSTGLKKMFTTWATSKGSAKFDDGQAGGKYTIPSGMGIASIVHNKVKGILGLDRAFICLTGAAPIRKETLEFFGKFDLVICELYGMSECTGPQTVSLGLYRKVGCCGTSLPGTELKIDHDPDRDEPGNGEICYRGRHIMMGYMKNPEKSAQTIDPEGWLHSGDVGKVDERGLLVITGRIKELIIGAGGENIAPVPIENRVMKNCPVLSSCMMVGDKRKYNVMLVTLHCKDDGNQGFTEDLSGAALEAGFGKTLSEARESKEMTELITKAITEANKEAVSNAAKVQKFAIVPCFSVPAGDLTPTLKLKRQTVDKKYKDLIDWLYTDNKTPYDYSKVTSTEEKATENA